MSNVVRKLFKGLFIQNEADRSKALELNVSNSSTTGTTTTIESAQTANRTITLPDATDTLVAEAASQTLTNKDIDGGTASNSNRITVPKNTTTNLNTLTDKQGTVAYDTTQNALVVNDGSSWNTVATSALNLIKLTRSTTLSAGTGETKVTSLTADIDTLSQYDNTNSKIVIDTAGYYKLSMYFTCKTFDAVVDLQYKINGGTAVTVTQAHGEPAEELFDGREGTDLIQLSASDEIEFYVNPNGLTRDCADFRFILEKV